jgi:hypothetical protein
MNKRVYKWAILAAVLLAVSVSVWFVQPFGHGPARAVASSTPDLVKPFMRDKSGYAVSASAPGDYRALAAAKRSPTELTLVCSPVDQSPVIDGDPSDTAWTGAGKITTLDFSSQRTINISSVRSGEMIFFLVTYPDVSPSTTHKSFRWDRQAGIYKPNNDREDMFVFKWSMQGLDADLSLRSMRSHQADVWFWKSCRTNPVGYADDKLHSYAGRKQGANSVEIVSPGGNGSMYLLRSGDSGQSAYEEKIVFDYMGDFAPRFSNRQPLGSRADVSARGCWSEGNWTVEFARKLDTEHDDDVVFDVGGKYLFIVSCYEMSGDTVHEEWSQPLYRTGDGFDRITLDIAR